MLLFLASIVPLFVGLAEDSKAYVVRSITYIEVQAQQGFPVIDSLPLHAGDLIRREIDISKATNFILGNDRAQLITNNLVKNIDTLKNIAQQ